MKVVYHKSVQKDLDEAWSYYEVASPGLGNQFLDEFLNVIGGISDNPRRWGYGTHGRRVALLRRFPYKLLYRVDDKHVKVLVVRHQKRSPMHGERRR